MGQETPPRRNGRQDPIVEAIATPGEWSLARSSEGARPLRSQRMAKIIEKIEHESRNVSGRKRCLSAPGFHKVERRGCALPSGEEAEKQRRLAPGSHRHQAFSLYCRELPAPALRSLGQGLERNAGPIGRDSRSRCASDLYSPPLPRTGASGNRCLMAGANSIGACGAPRKVSRQNERQRIALARLAVRATGREHSASRYAPRGENRLLGQLTQRFWRHQPQKFPTSVRSAALEACNSCFLHPRKHAARPSQLRNHGINVRRMTKADHFLRLQPREFLQKLRRVSSRLQVLTGANFARRKAQRLRKNLRGLYCSYQRACDERIGLDLKLCQPQCCQARFLHSPCGQRSLRIGRAVWIRAIYCQSMAHNIENHRLRHLFLFFSRLPAKLRLQMKLLFKKVSFSLQTQNI